MFLGDASPKSGNYCTTFLKHYNIFNFVNVWFTKQIISNLIHDISISEFQTDHQERGHRPLSLLFGGSLSLFCSVLSLHRFQQGSQSNDETTLGSNRCVLSVPDGQKPVRLSPISSCGLSLRTLQPSSHFSCIHLNRARRKVGCIIGIQQFPIIFLGITLWQEERLRGFPVFIDGREIETGV